jgi:HD-like signal output (HDOD) protein
MQTVPPFEGLLPELVDPAKAALRDTLLQVLTSKGEILPSANSPRGKLWHLVNTPETSIGECEEVIKLDTALCSRILRVANSGLYGAGTEDISNALLKLGLKFVREQVFNVSVFKQYSGWTLPREWDLFWLRNIFVARSCERLAALYGPTSGSEYLAGLIHDIGWLVLATYVPDEFNQLFAGGKPVAQAEKELLPFGHAEIAAAIAARSMLAPRAVDAILHHHHPVVPAVDISPGESPQFLAVILHICDGMADCCNMDMFGHSDLGLEEIEQGSEVSWLRHYGPAPDLFALAEEELQKSQQIFEAYFSNRNFN